MWAIIKFDKKNINLLKNDLNEKIGKGVQFYIPKIGIKKIKSHKLMIKEINLLGDYMFCFHENLSNDRFLNSIKFCRGMKSILNGHKLFQSEIIRFISKCKKAENEDGYLRFNFCQIDLKKSYKFISGPFIDKIFRIIEVQQRKIDILIGNIKTSIKKENYLIKPI